MASDPGFDGSGAGTWGNARSRSIWQWQLILTVSTVAIALAASVLEPTLFGDWAFSVGMILIVLVTCAALATPWPLFGRRAVVLLPLLDIAAIALLAANGTPLLGFLWVFPLGWIATYYTLPWVIGALAEITAFLIADALVNGISPDSGLSLLIVLLALGFLGISINIGSRRTRAFRRLLRRQFAQLGRTLTRVEAQEQRASTLFNSLDTGLARIDRHGAFRAANSAYRALYSMDTMGHLHPSSAVEYDDYQGSALPRSQTTLARATRGEVLTDHRIWLFDSAGTWHALDVNTRPIAGSTAEPATTLVTVRDVTATETAARHQQTVASVVSHELRNPLTAIAGHTDLLLERTDLPAEVLGQLAVIENASLRMERLITSTLANDGHTSAITDGAVDLSAVVAASVDAFAPAAHAAEVTLEPSIVPGLSIIGDGFRLRQVLDNLVGNAVKYTLRGGTVRVSVEAVDGSVELRVVDTGIGISSEDLAHVFDPYFRAQSALASGIPGTGLGMSIARDIIAANDGTLEISSALGSGTTAVVRLPEISVSVARKGATP